MASAEISIPFPYGDNAISIRIPLQNLGQIVRHKVADTLIQPELAVRQALDTPISRELLEAILRQRLGTIVIVCDDNTRRTPTQLIIPILIDRLSQIGVDDGRISILIALGSHRLMNAAEVEEKIPAAILRRIRVFQHNCHDHASLEAVGVSPLGIDVIVNKQVIEASFVIGVGSVLPHPDVGWSGGGKIILPGVAGIDSINAMHTQCALSGENMLGVDWSPIRSDIESVAQMCGLSFLLNTVLDGNGNLRAVICGQPRDVYWQAVRTAKEVYGSIPGVASDLTIVSSYPNDQDFWQASKALLVGAGLTSQDGTVLLVTPCPDGVGPHPLICDYLSQSIPDLRAMLLQRLPKVDQAALAIALELRTALQGLRVGVVSTGLSQEAIRKMGFKPYTDVQPAVREAIRRSVGNAVISVVTHGGMVCPLAANTRG